MGTLSKVDFADPQSDLRRMYLAEVRQHQRACAVAKAGGIGEWEPQWPRWFDLTPFWHLRCGAKAKSTGQPCRRTDIYGNSRCKFHGGLSTGPKTPEGKARAAANGRRAREPHEQVQETSGSYPARQQ